MTNRIAALEDMAEKVEARVWGNETLTLRSPPRDFTIGLDFPAMDRRTRLAWSAYHGSLDAAKELNEAVLPGYDYRIERHDGDSAALVFRSGRMDHYVDNWQMCPDAIPGRAWLLAILRALIAEAKDEK